MLGLGKVKPVWLAEIGTRTAESFDGENWYSLPSLTRAKVFSGFFFNYRFIDILSVTNLSGHLIRVYLYWTLKVQYYMQSFQLNPKITRIFYFFLTEKSPSGKI